MTKSSLQLISECQGRGLLSKEASTELLQKREQIIKLAMRSAAKKLFGSIRKAGPPPEKAKGGILARITGSAGMRQAGPASAPPVKQSFKDKLMVGGLTGGGPGRDGAPAHSAGWGDVAANLGKMMALAGMTAGATAGIGGLMRHSKDKKLRKDIDLSYKKMFIEHPGLKDVEEHDPGRVRRHFGVLARYAPSLAADPTVAGTWVQATAQIGQINTGDIKNLAETQSRIDDAREERGGVQLAPMKVTEFATRAMLAAK